MIDTDSDTKVRAEVIQEIYRAIQLSNEFRQPTDRVVCAEETILYGAGALDSLGLVSLILDVEEAINARFGTQLVLADEHAMSQRRNPFRDVRSLADYVMARLWEKNRSLIAP
jgi:acyl carrier protein